MKDRKGKEVKVNDNVVFFDEKGKKIRDPDDKREVIRGLVNEIAGDEALVMWFEGVHYERFFSSKEILVVKVR
jgi:hypothetical protein